MWHHRVRLLLRLVVLSLLLGLIPPAATPQAHAAIPQPAAATTVAAPISSPPVAPARMPRASNSPPSPDVTPASRPANAPIGQLTVPNGASRLTLIPFHSTGYRYSTVTPNTGAGFEQPSFDDSGFATGAAAFGSTSGICALNNSNDVKTVWPANTDILVRKSFVLPPGAHNLQVRVLIDNDVDVFLNGHGIGSANHDYCPDLFSEYFDFTASDTYLVAGTNLLAVRGKDRGDVRYLDMQVTADGGAVPDDQVGVEPECQCAVGGPINTHSGNYWTKVTDLSVQTPGPDLTWTRTYASQAVGDTSGVLGYGWQTPYLARLILPTMPGYEAGTVIVFSPNTNRERFRINADGTYTAFQGIFSTMTQANGLITQTLPDQQQRVFDATTGRLQSMRDAQGRQVVLNYTGTPSRLTSIADALDGARALILGYDTSGRINSVSDGIGRLVIYGYDTNNNLTSVTDVMQHLTTYTYATPANHLLTKIAITRDGTPETIEEMTYGFDTNGRPRVLTQTLQDQRQLAFTYPTTPNDPTIVTTTGVDSSQDIQRFDYAADNTLKGVTTNNQAVLATAYDAGYNPAAVADGEGRVTQTAFNAVGLPTAQTNNQGKTTKVQYDTLNRPVLVTDTLGIATAYQYDQYNNVTRIIEGITTASNIRATTIYTYSYNVRYTGDRLLVKQQRPDGVVIRYDYPTSGTITKRGQVTSMTVGDGLGTLQQVTTYDYDKAGRVMTTTLGFGTSLARVDITEYNPDNTIARTIQNYKDKNFTSTKPDEDIITTFGYDEFGRQIWVKDVYNHYDVTHYKTNGQVDWTARNLTGYSGGNLPTLPPTYSVTQPYANVATFYSYDGLGRLVLLTETGLLPNTFNAGTLQFTGTPPQRVTRTEYDALSRPIAVTLNYKAGQTPTEDVNVLTQTFYDGAGNPIWQRDGFERWTKTEYDSLGRPAKTIVNYQNGSVSANEATDQDLITIPSYDDAGRVTQQITNWVNGVFDPLVPSEDRISTMQYDTLGRMFLTTQNVSTSSDAALNRITETLYDPAKGRVIGQGSYQQPGISGAVQRWSNQQYDQLGRTIKTIQNCTRNGAPQNPSFFACDAFSSSISDRNVPVQMTYDALNRVTDTTDALSQVTHTQYDGLGRVLKTTQNYKPNTNGGNYSASTPDVNVSTSYRYDALGRTLAMTDTLDKAITYAVNALGQTTQTTDQVGRVTTMGYDGNGTLRWTKRPDGQLTVYQLDGLGRTIATIVNYQDGVVSAGEPTDRDLITRTNYDAAGRRTQTIDPAGHVTKYDYDNQDHLIQVTENLSSPGCAQPPCDVATHYEYDRAGNRTAIIDANSHTRTFTYDAADEQKTAVDALTHQTKWDYDNLGRMIKQTDPRQSPPGAYDLTFGYDGLDRPTTTNAGSSANLATITNAYDALGRRTSLTDGSGATPTTFQYDALGRIKQVNAPNTLAVNYTYNGRGLRTKVTYPTTGTIFNYTYLNDGRLQQVTQGAALTPVARYNYDAIGRVVQAVSNTNAALNSQVITNYRYDGADRLRGLRTSEAGTTVSGYQYDTDRLGLRTTITETLPLSPILSTTRVKTMTFDGASLTDTATGADLTTPTPSTLVLTTTGALKGGYSVSVPNIANSFLREDFTAANEIYVTLYLRLDAVPTSSTRIVQISNVTNGVSTTISELQVLTSRKLRIRNNGTMVGLDSAALTVGKLYRVGIHQKATSTNTSILEAFLASGDDQFASAFAANSTLTISLATTRVNVGATTSSNVIAITVDDIAIDTAALAQPSVNGLRASTTQAAGDTAASNSAPAIDPLAAQAPASESSGGSAALRRMPLAFVPNAGQTNPSVRMHARGLHGNLFFGMGELTLALRPPTRDKTPPKDSNTRRQKPKNIPPVVVQQRWISAKPTAEVTGTLKLRGRTNFLIGNDRSKWRTNLVSFADILTRQLYDGIDQYYTGLDGQLKTTYVVAPGADPSRIRWRYVGADSVTVDTNGNLVVRLPAPASTLTDTEVLSSTLTELAPVATQTINEREVSIPVRFAVGPDGSVSFALGDYDHTQPLIIDPTLTYTTYLGGSGTDDAEDIAVDSSGNAYVVGTTDSAYDFPPAAPLQPYQGNYDVFVSKLSPDGSGFVYSTYFGGSAEEEGFGIAVDAAGYAYITGATESDDTTFPVTPNVVQGSCSINLSSCQDAFVAMLNPTGSQLVYSTYLGGTNQDYGVGIAVDQAGNAYVIGNTQSSDFPQAFLSTIQANYAGGTDAFVAKLNPDASQVVYSTYLGGSVSENGEGIAVDLAGNAFVTGATSSNGLFYSTLQGYSGNWDAFVARINSAGSALDYGTYIGGSAGEHGYGIAVDKNSIVYVTGDTQSTSIPNFSGSPSGGFMDAFVAKLTWNGGSLSYGYTLYLGGSGADSGYDIALDRSGNAFVTGTTNSSTFPNNGSQSYAGGFDAFMTQIDAYGYWTYSTYLGGSADDYGFGIAVDSLGIAYATGLTGSSTFGPYAGSNPVQVSYGGAGDAFVAKLALGGTPTPPATRVLSYGYDGLQRLTGATENPGAVYTYTFDLAGNRSDVWQDGLPLEHHDYDAANQVVGWTYDAAGNLINDGTNQYTYDALNRTSSVRQGGTTTTYTYNGDGTLVKQIGSGAATLYTQDLASPLTQILQTKVGTATATDYIYGLNRLASLNGSTTTWYAADALGSVRRTFDGASATPQSTINYDPWGVVESGSVPTFGFTGELQDAATGLVNLRARWYSTTRGTFTAHRWRTNESWDTIPYSHHPYAYVLSNPVLFTDHSGRYATYGDEGGYDPYCQDGSRRSANGQCQYEFVADAQAGLGGGAGGMPPDPEEYWNRLIQTKPETPDPSGVFDEDKGQPGQEIFVPTDLGPGIVIQKQPSLQQLSNREIFTCPDEWPSFVTNSSHKPNPLKQVGYGSTDLSRLVIKYRKEHNISFGKNVAVFEYIDDEGQTSVVIKESRFFGGHAERLIAKELESQGVNPSQVTRIYSELEPCSLPFNQCKNFIARTYPEAEVTYSFEYGDTPESRKAGNKKKEDAIRSEMDR